MARRSRRELTAETRSAVAIGTVATVVRAIWVLLMSRTPKGLSDPVLYMGLARNLANGSGYISLGHNPTAYYPPGYPMMLGAVQWFLNLLGLGGHLVLVVGLLQSLLGGVAAGLVVLIGTRVADSFGTGSTRSRSLRIGVIAGSLMAIWPNLVIYSSLILSETLFIAVFCALIYVLIRYSDHERDDADERELDPREPLEPRSWRSHFLNPKLVAAAILLGICTLIRPQSTLLIAPGIVLIWRLQGRSWGWLLRSTVVLGVGLLLVVSPWTVRNTVKLGGFVAISTNIGDNLCIGFNPAATGGFMLTDNCETGEKYIDSTGAELRHDAENRSRALHWASTNISKLPGLGLTKVRLTFASDADGLRALESFGDDAFLSSGTRSWLRASSNIYFFTVLALSIAGAAVLIPSAIRNRRDSTAGLFVLLTVVAGVAIPVLSFADPRFKVPLAPSIAVLAAIALDAAISRSVAPGDRKDAQVAAAGVD